MKKIIDRIKNNKGSMMMEAMILIAVGLLVLMGFMIFLDSGDRFAENAFKQIGKAEKQSDANAKLGKFERH